MRRKDREMGREFGLAVIDKAEFVVMSMVDHEGNPYGVPLSVVRVDNMVYLHGARSGKKMDCLKNQSSVHLTFVGEVKREKPISDTKLAEAREEGKLRSLVSKMFTTEFESAMVWGTAEFVEDDAEKRKALEALSIKYSQASMPFFDMAMEESLTVTQVIRVEVKNLTAKRKKYDEAGEEMKWGRMDPCGK
ncbi:pyridoxamine 5'-phosphate oxidase family protein [Clostridia bacterium]|nr:pyridoxamine 5'-phosphate oxidase family protein [Clostridia bacterium]